MNLKHTLISTALALGALAGSASSQPVRDWQVKFGKQTQTSCTSIRAGSSGIGISLTSRRGHTRSIRTQHAHYCGHKAGYYKNQRQRVWVPGHTDREWVPAVIQVTYTHCGERIEKVICPGRWEHHHHPGHYEDRMVRVWVQASCRCSPRGITTYPRCR